MSDCGKIRIKAERTFSAWIRAPHCKEFRGIGDSGIGLFMPVTGAFKQIGLVPPPESLMERAESSISRVEFMNSMHRPLEYPSDIKRYGDLLRKGLKLFKDGNTSYREEALGWADVFLQKILRPDDLTFEQRLSTFDYFATEVLNKVEEDYYRSGNQYRCVINRHFTLKEWNDSGRATVEKRFADVFKAETVMRDMAGYDWRPLSFFFGTDLERFAQLKTATLNAEMELSRGILKREYDDFLDAVRNTSQMGAMRDNQIQLESNFLGKYKVAICIRDTGGGAKFSRAVRDSEMVGVARDVGSAGKGLFNFLFGKK